MANNKKLLNLENAAAHLNCDAKFLKNSATSGELPYIIQGTRMMFEMHHLDNWYSNLILRNPSERHMMTTSLNLADLCMPEAVDDALEGKTKAAVLKNLAALCEKTGFLYDPDEFLSEIRAREEIATTAMSAGVALVHPVNHDEFLCEHPFVALARSAQPVFFGDPDGKPTDLFFVVAAPDPDSHLRILARICQIVAGTTLLEDLRNAEDAQAMHELLRRHSSATA